MSPLFSGAPAAAPGCVTNSLWDEETKSGIVDDTLNYNDKLYHNSKGNNRDGGGGRDEPSVLSAGSAIGKDLRNQCIIERYEEE